MNYKLDDGFDRLHTQLIFLLKKLSKHANRSIFVACLACFYFFEMLSQIADKYVDDAGVYGDTALRLSALIEDAAFKPIARRLFEQIERQRLQVVNSMQA